MSLHSSSTTIAASLVARATHIGVNCLENEAGRVVSEGALDLTAKQVSSAKGRIAAKGDLVTVGTLEQQGGELASQGTLTLDADSLDNRNGGLVSADGGSPPRRQIDNRGGEISSVAKVALAVREQLDNRGAR